jgi:hypothetical protein
MSTPLQDAAVGRGHPSIQFEGRFVRMAGRKLVLTDQKGKQIAHALTPDATVTCDGMPCTSEDLRAGARVRLTMNAEDRNKSGSGRIARPQSGVHAGQLTGRPSACLLGKAARGCGTNWGFLRFAAVHPGWKGSQTMQTEPMLMEPNEWMHPRTRTGEDVAGGLPKESGARVTVNLSQQDLLAPWRTNSGIR